MNFRKRKKRKTVISLDEIFMDSRNTPAFDSYQFEGRMEKPLAVRPFFLMVAVFSFVLLLFVVRVAQLQIVRGENFFRRSEDNHLRFVSLLSERGAIYDRNGELLAGNSLIFSLVVDKEKMNEILEKKLSELRIFLSTEPLADSLAGNVSGYYGGISEGEVLAVFRDWEKISEVYKQWDDLPLRIEQNSIRYYKDLVGLAHIVGYTSYVDFTSTAVGSAGSSSLRSGVAGVEEFYNEILSGVSGLKIIEIDSLNEIKSESVQKKPIAGKNINLSVDYKLQNKIYEIFSDLADERGFGGGAGVVIDVESGEILSLVSYPEFKPQIMSDGFPVDTINKHLSDGRKPFLNRAVSGLYAPGSIVKPFMALAALSEKIISPEKQIFSSGSISIPNPYFPEQKSVFLDWKAHGWVDMKKALAVSSNVYFYTIGGGYEDMAGLGIKKIKEYMEKFGLGLKTGIDLRGEAEGIIPDPLLKNKDGDSVWRIGDTYNMSIGQGDFLVTPVQMAVAIAMVANGGFKISPTVILKNEEGVENEGMADKGVRLDIPDDYFKIVREGMRKAVLEGTASALSYLPVKIAAKTGTAELGSLKQFVNSWIIAFWPYEHPRFALAFVLEKGRVSNLIGSVYAANELFNWMFIHTPQYLTE